MTNSSRKLRRMQRKQQRQAEAQAQAQTETQNADSTATEESQAKPIRKRVQRLLETSGEMLEQSELEFLDEMLETAREAIALNRTETRQRNEARKRGEPVTTRWEVSPSVANAANSRTCLRPRSVTASGKRAQPSMTSDADFTSTQQCPPAASKS